MKNADRMRIGWLNRQLVTIYGPFPCYNKWEIRAYVVALTVFAAFLVWVAK